MDYRKQIKTTKYKQEVKIMTRVYGNGWLPEVFNDFLENERMQKTNATAPAINVKETEDEYIVELAAPGMKKEDFEVHINDEGDLTIKMEHKTEENVEEKKYRYLRREFAYSTFEQALILPDDVDRQQISAKVEDGVLNVLLPKIRKEEHKVSRQIAIG